MFAKTGICLLMLTSALGFWCSSADAGWNSRRHRDNKQPPVDTNTSWKFRYSPNMPSSPERDGAGVKFTFPTRNGVHYLVTSPATRQLTESLTADVGVTVTTGTPVFEYKTETSNTCINPAQARLFVQRTGDDLSGRGRMEFYRWWYDDGFVIAPGQGTIVGNFTDLAKWTSVFGKKADTAPAQFADALANVSVVGLTFGGGCYYGHGVYVPKSSGNAVFHINSFVAK